MIVMPAAGFTVSDTDRSDCHMLMNAVIERSRAFISWEMLMVYLCRLEWCSFSVHTHGGHVRA